MPMPSQQKERREPSPHSLDIRADCDGRKIHTEAKEISRAERFHLAAAKESNPETHLDRPSLLVVGPLRPMPLSSVEIKKTTVNRIVCSGNEGGLIRAQKQSKGGHFLGFPHAAYRL